MSLGVFAIGLLLLMAGWAVMTSKKLGIVGEVVTLRRKVIDYIDRY